MKQLIVLDYEKGDITIIDMSSESIPKFSKDYDEYVYDALGFNESNIHYMIVDGRANINYVSEKRVCPDEQNASRGNRGH